MKKLSKIVALLLAGALTMPMFTACGGGGGSSAATPSVSDKAAKELKNAKEGSTVTIDMKGETKLPASVTKEIAGKDVTVELDMGGGMVWSFNGLDVPKGGVRLDLGVKTGTKTIPAKVINALTGEATTIQLQLDHNGPFVMSLKLSVDLGKKHDGLYANLYFYNPKSGELEFQSAGLISGGKANDGNQFAELNAEKVGSLYQDVLTAPGATLSWAFAHRSRVGTGTNTMYLVIASTKDAQSITTQTEISSLVQSYTSDGASVSYNGGTFTLWKFEGNPNYWQDHMGTYTVPTGQYATRFFFVSASGKTTGNLIDGIHFNEVQSYVIEYYLNGELQQDLTENSHADLDKVITPSNTGAEVLRNAILTGSTINGKNYGGIALSIKARKDLDPQYKDCRNVLRLYYTTGTVSVKKVVEFEKWEDLTDKEKEALFPNGYTAAFDLYDGDKVVANASLTIDLDDYANKTAVAEFKKAEDSTQTFAPIANHDYRVVERSTDDEALRRIYEQVTTYDAPSQEAGAGLIQTDDHATGSCTVKNTYHLLLTTLTIRKEGWQDVDENQTFVYRVEGADDITKGKVDLAVTIHGNDSTTINNLPVGTYKVTEVETWSWRYTAGQSSVTVTLKDPGTVTFTNTRVTVGNGDRWRWLNGSSWTDNRWRNGTSLKSGGEEGSEGNG